MIKVSHFSGENSFGPTIVPLFQRNTDSVFEKVAAPTLLPDVVRFIEGLRPQNDSVYELVNALGASEFFGANVNADAFTEASLIHRPDNWTGNPLVDKITAKDWPYGFPTFYSAHPYMHHRNKDPKRAFGTVDFAAWNPHMRRVELVTRVDKAKCLLHGGTTLWDKLSQGQYMDVSMGTKVKFDLCSICTDWDLYHKAEATFDPKKQVSPDIAILAYHKNIKKIRGLAETRRDYCEHMLRQINKILPDGRRVFVYNPFPKFFDISFVWVGADRTAKVMMHLQKTASSIFDMGRGSAFIAESLGYDEKVASPTDFQKYLEQEAKIAQAQKSSEMVKDVIPSQFMGKAIPQLNAIEKDIPRETLDLLGKAPLESSLATTAALGIPLRPREFQRVVLTSIGKSNIADQWDSCGCVIPDVCEPTPMRLSPEDILGPIAKLLLPLLAERSCAAPLLNTRALMIRIQGTDTPQKPVTEKKAFVKNELLQKIGSLYTAYRQSVPTLMVYAQPLLHEITTSIDANHKLASVPIEDFFSPFTIAYLREAFRDELR